MSEKRFSLGVDYGTGSVRSVLFDLTDGSEVASSVFAYPHGSDGVIVDSGDHLLARQHPGDYAAGLMETVAAVVAEGKKSGFEPSMLAGIGIDATASTPIPVDESGVALGLSPRFADNPAAMAWLWKDHTSYAEADRINELAGPLGLLNRCGGAASSEWYWAKILHCKNTAPDVFSAAFSWVELSDYVPGLLTGNTDPLTMARNICAAGHKAIYDDRWGGLPPVEFLNALDPALVPLRSRYTQGVTSDKIAGYLTEENGSKLGLIPGIPVAVGAVDAHLGAVGAGVRPGQMVAIIGTSTCYMLVHPLSAPLAEIPGIRGIVPGSIIPGMYGLEAGQSATGDIFNWFVKNLAGPKYFESGDPHAALTAEAVQLTPGESGLLALDWNNGVSTTLNDPLLTGLVLGTTLHTTAGQMYRAMIEGTAFGAKTIANRFMEYGVPLDEVIACGGIAAKNPFLVQVYADVLNRPVKVSRSDQSCALGAAIFGAVAGGAFPTVLAAQDKMSGMKETVYQPNPHHAPLYETMFGYYSTLYDTFGGVGGNEKIAAIMKGMLRLARASD